MYSESSKNVFVVHILKDYIKNLHNTIIIKLLHCDLSHRLSNALSKVCALFATKRENLLN